MADPKRVTMGRIGGPYGVKGWVKLISFTEPRENILQFRYWRVMLGQAWVELEMDQSKPHGKGLIAHFAGYDDPETARRLNDVELTVPADVLPNLEADDYYWHQLIGLRVVSSSGHVLGKVDKLFETGANDVLVVAATADSVDDRERLIPWLPGQVVKEVSLERNLVVVDWEPDYLA
jgi:16S rRNA processing protein RimM